MIRNFLLLTIFIFSEVIIGQVKTDKQYLDSIKAKFVSHKAANDIDEKWFKEVYTEDLFDELQKSIVEIDLDEKVDYDLNTELLKKRLKKLDAKSPFNIEYHPSLENVIKYYLKNRKHSYERLMSVAKYYFPMFEESLAKYNVPLEIKYLAIVESALNPKAVSHMGASGIWQFMYHTGKQYNLEINSYVDERNDPIKATEAACKYMVNMYQIFGDWDLVLASYNSGPGNVSKAIRRSNGQKNYWNIRHNLPKETQGYLPAFLATMYIFEYHKEHGIKPKKAINNFLQTDTIVVKQNLSFEHISSLLDIPEAEIQFLNPSYKLKMIPYVEGEKHSIRLPLNKVGVFASNEKLIYEYCSYISSKKEKIKIDSSRSGSVEYETKVIYHTVKKKETASSIAKKYGVSTRSLSKSNRLRKGRVKVGQTLKIKISKPVKKKVANTINKDSLVSKSVDSVAVVSDEPTTDEVENKSEPKHKKESKTEKKSSKKTHTVKKGETLSSIADEYGVTVKELKKWNRLKRNRIQVGQKLKLKGK